MVELIVCRGNKEVRTATKMSSGDVKKNKPLPQDTNSVEENGPLGSDESTPVMVSVIVVDQEQRKYGEKQARANH